MDDAGNGASASGFRALRQQRHQVLVDLPHLEGQRARMQFVTEQQRQHRRQVRRQARIPADRH